MRSPQAGTFFLIVSCSLFAFCFNGSSVSAKSNAPPLPEALKQLSGKVSTPLGTAAIQPLKNSRTIIQGQDFSSGRTENVPTDFVVPDSQGTLLIIAGEKRKKENAHHVNARELTLKIRELAEQLITGMDAKEFQGSIAFPVSFVNLDDFDAASTFGRYLAEQFFHEFVQRGITATDYRIAKEIQIREGEGEFLLSRDLSKFPIPQNAFVLVGTYYADPQNVFVNARILNPRTGRILQTANMVFQSNQVIKRMLAKSGKKYATSPIKIRSYQETVAPKSNNPFDQGEDIH